MFCASGLFFLYHLKCQHQMFFILAFPSYTKPHLDILSSYLCFLKSTLNLSFSCYPFSVNQRWRVKHEKLSYHYISIWFSCPCLIRNRFLHVWCVLALVFKVKETNINALLNRISEQLLLTVYLRVRCFNSYEVLTKIAVYFPFPFVFCCCFRSRWAPGPVLHAAAAWLWHHGEANQAAGQLLPGGDPKDGCLPLRGGHQAWQVPPTSQQVGWIHNVKLPSTKIAYNNTNDM